MKRIIILLMMILLCLTISCTDSKKTKTLSEADEAILNDVLDNFAMLAAVPRQSGHEQAISNKLKAWAEDLGLSVMQNAENDLVFDVPATKGYEHLPLTALQAHIDMDCVALEGETFNPQKDPIKYVVNKKAGTVKAKGTTLGADDGAGVSVIMSIVKGKMAHGPLRIIFTTNEETTMSGALAISAEQFSGVKYCINIDSEDSSTVTVSSAADAKIIIDDIPKMTATAKDATFKITISGLLGGHSGLMIGEGRCNGIIAVADILANLSTHVKYELVSMTGGIASNAIPSKAEAVINIAANDETALRSFIAKKLAELQSKYKKIEKNIAITVEKTEIANKVFEEAQTKNIINYIKATIDGVYSMSGAIDGLVESSSNLGVISINADIIKIIHLLRSSSTEKLAEIIAHQETLARQYGLTQSVENGSKAWPANPNSVLLDKLKKIYKEQNGSKIKVVAVHAGLECGAFAELVPNLDMISIGPDIHDAHSPNETLFINSIPKIWHILEKLLVEVE